LVDILKQVRRTIGDHGLLAGDDGVVVGVSGGPDSLCLLHVLLHLRQAYGLQLYVAHLHHGARGADADADAEFVVRLAAEWDLPVTVACQDVPALARENRLAFEEAARRARYAFLAQVAGKVGACKIAVGHNADDQAETVLMHFLRGAGPAGLRGMLPATPITDYRMLEPLRRQEAGGKTQEAGGKRQEAKVLHPASCLIIRPLLEVPRVDIESYCAEQDLKPRFDRSNLDTTYFRNCLRHDLLPLLETYNPNLRARLCRMAAVIAADHELLIQLQEQAWDDTVQEERDSTIVLDRAAWRVLPVALQRSLLRRAVYRLRKSLRDVDFVHVEDARRVGLSGETGAQATLPGGLTFTVGYDTLVVGDEGDVGSPPDEPLLWCDEPLPVRVPGVVHLPDSEWALHAEMVEAWDLQQVADDADIWTAYLNLDALATPLMLRRRCRGDRFCPQGMQGHSTKLSAFLINRKVPRAWRDRVPLLVAGDEIVWVCGQRVGESAVVKARSQRVARLCFVRS
jgi:tRNA(Ile)-lysidine synthase